MKIGVSSYSFMKHIQQTGANYFDVCDFAKEIGFEGIEFIDLSLDVQKADSLLALAEAIRAHCAEIGLPIIAYTVGADFLARGESEIARVKGQVDIAKALGAPVMRHDTTWTKLPEGETWQGFIEQVKRPIREVTEYAAALGIKTCTENHGYMMQDANRMEALMQAVAHPNYGWLVDIGNFLCADEPAYHALPIAVPYAFHVHAKDFIVKPCGEEAPGSGWMLSRGGAPLRGTVVGHGAVPVKWCLDYLQANGYDGFVSLEFEGMEECLPALRSGYEYLRKCVRNDA